MPTNARIQDLISRNDHERLLQELVRPEAPLPLSSRLLLNGEGGLPTVCRALSLVRLVDGGYRPSSVAIGLASSVVEDARAGLDAPLWEEATDDLWARRAAQLAALEAWDQRMQLLRKLGVTPVAAPSLEETSMCKQRLIDALASWLHAQLACEDPLEATPLRITLLWLLSERVPAALSGPLERLRQRLDESGAAHHPALGTLFVVASRRSERLRALTPALGFAAA